MLQVSASQNNDGSSGDVVDGFLNEGDGIVDDGVPLDLCVICGEFWIPVRDWWKLYGTFESLQRHG